MGRNQLDARARGLLHYTDASPIPVAEYARDRWADGVWRGDSCGCTDDRCISYHHEDYEECGCVVWLIDDYIARGRPARRYAFGRQPVQVSA